MGDDAGWAVALRRDPLDAGDDSRARPARGLPAAHALVGRGEVRGHERVVLVGADERRGSAVDLPQVGLDATRATDDQRGARARSWASSRPWGDSGHSGGSRSPRMITSAWRTR